MRFGVGGGDGGLDKESFTRNASREVEVQSRTAARCYPCFLTPFVGGGGNPRSGLTGDFLAAFFAAFLAVFFGDCPFPADALRDFIEAYPFSRSVRAGAAFLSLSSQK
jgi:hypothetical protein